MISYVWYNVCIGGILLRGGGEGESFYTGFAALKAINVCGVYIFLNFFRLLLVMYLGCLSFFPSSFSLEVFGDWQFNLEGSGFLQSGFFS